MKKFSKFIAIILLILILGGVFFTLFTNIYEILGAS